MKELKLFLSQFHDEDFHDEVSGITFKQSPTLDIYSISLEDDKVSGIQSAIRKNILIPYDLETRDFVNNTNLAVGDVKISNAKIKEVEIAKVEVAKEEVAKEEVAKEEVAQVEAAPEVKPAKKAAKRAPKKEETN